MHLILCISLYASHSMHFILCLSCYAFHSIVSILTIVWTSCGHFCNWRRRILHISFCTSYSMHLIQCISFYAFQSMHLIICISIYASYSMHFILLCPSWLFLKLIAETSVTGGEGGGWERGPDIELLPQLKSNFSKHFLHGFLESHNKFSTIPFSI